MSDKQTFDVQRARDILTTAQEKGMYPDPFPEADNAIIMEAEKIVALARQAARVAEEIGKDKVKDFQAVEAVLFTAQVDGGTSSANGGGDEAPPPPTEEEASAGEPPAPAAEAESSPPEPEPAQEQQHEELVVESSEAASSETFAPGQKWVDENGEVWVIDQLLNNDNLEVKPDGKNEQLIVPASFLVKRVDEEIAAAEPEPTPEPQAEETPPEPEPEPAPVAEEKPAEAEQPSVQETPEPETPSQPAAADPIGDDYQKDPEYKALIDRVLEDYQRAKLPIPGDVPDPPDMPSDLTSVPDIQARKLHSQFNACAARAHYLLGMERQAKIDCGRVRKRHMAPAMAQARKELGAKATVTEVKDQAEENTTVLKWRVREDRHADREAAFKDLYEIYTQNVVVLSRDWSMRDNDQRGS